MQIIAAPGRGQSTRCRPSQCVASNCLQALSAPRNALARAVHAEVLAADPANRGQAHRHFKVRLWPGLLDPEMESHVIIGEEDKTSKNSSR